MNRPRIVKQDRTLTRPSSTSVDHGQDSPHEPGHRHLTAAVSTYMAGNCISVDAVGRIISTVTGEILPLTTQVTVANDAWYTLCFNGSVPHEHIQRIIEVQFRVESRKRGKRLIDGIINQPATPAGLDELRKFVTAVTGREDELDLAVMRHFLWLVKRTASGKPREHDLMPVFFGGQGSGKTTAVKRLVSPLAELTETVGAETLTDERKRMDLGRFFIGRWEEMEGASKQEVERLKTTLTCETASMRPMRTNDNVTIPRVMNFIGTSNKPIGAMVKDTGGARRFYEIHTAEKIHWSTINAIDYALLWTAVSEQDSAPILPYLTQLRRHQSGLRHRDSVAVWLDDETWGAIEWAPAPQNVIAIPAYDATHGETGEHVRGRYCAWCQDANERPIPTNVFYQRLAEEGFTNHRPRTDPSEKRPRRYLKPGQVDQEPVQNSDEG